MRKVLYLLVILIGWCFQVSAQAPKAVDAPALASAPSATPAPTPIPLSVVQMQQLRIVQTERALAAESAAKAEAQYRALIAEFRWQLGVNPAEFEGELQPLDQQGSLVGFVPKPKPQPPEQPKEVKPEPKIDGKGK